MLINCTNELPWMLYFYFKRVLQIAAHCQKNLDLAVAAKESGEIVNYQGGRGFCIYSVSSCLMLDSAIHQINHYLADKY